MFPHLSLQAKLKSKRDRDTLELNGRRYSLNQKSESKRNGGWSCYWTCSRKTDDKVKCRGTAITRRPTEDGIDQDFLEGKPHICEVNTVEMANKKARQHYLDLVSHGVDSLRAYVRTYNDLNNVAIVGPEYIAQNGISEFMCQGALRSAVRRKISKQYPPQPRNILDFHLNGPERRRFKNTLDGRRFFLFSFNLNGKKIICYATDARLQLLQFGADNVQIDGTWKVVPRIINKGKGQLVTIHCIVQGVSIPCIFAFLPAKDKPTYRAFFRALKQVCAARNIEINIARIMCDFESALRTELVNAWPAVEVRGCYFHFCSCIWKHVKVSRYLRHWYYTQPAFKKFVKSCMCLAYLPTNRILATYHRLCRDFRDECVEMFGHNEMIVFLTYFEAQWLNNTAVPKKDWNIYNDNRHNTNNAVEGWHNGFRKRMGTHPPIWMAIEKLQEEEEIYDMKLAQLAAGHHMQRANQENVNIARRNSELKSQYQRGMLTSLEYVTRLATVRDEIVNQEELEDDDDEDDEENEDAEEEG